MASATLTITERFLWATVKTGALSLVILFATWEAKDTRIDQLDQQYPDATPYVIGVR
jgi:hypothetical protein